MVLGGWRETCPGDQQNGQYLQPHTVCYINTHYGYFQLAFLEGVRIYIKLVT